MEVSVYWNLLVMCWALYWEPPSTLPLNLTSPGYSFPVVAVYNHKLGGFKQQEIILSQFWRPEEWNQSYWGKIKVSAGLHSPWEIPLLAPPSFQWLPAFHGLWPCYCSLYLHGDTAFSGLRSSLPPPPSYKCIYDFIEDHLHNPG